MEERREGERKSEGEKNRMMTERKGENLGKDKIWGNKRQR